MPKITVKPAFFLTFCIALLLVAALGYTAHRSEQDLLRSAQQETNAKAAHVQQKLNALNRELENLRSSPTLEETLHAKIHEKTDLTKSGSILKQWEKRFGRVAKAVFTDSLTSGELNLVYEDGTLLGQVKCNDGVAMATSPKMLRNAPYEMNKQLFRQLLEQAQSNKLGINFLNTLVMGETPAVQFGAAVSEKNAEDKEAARAALILNVYTESLTNPNMEYTSGLPLVEAVVDSRKAILLESDSNAHAGVPNDLMALTASGQSGIVKDSNTYFISSSPIYPNTANGSYYWVYVSSIPQSLLFAQALSYNPGMSALLLSLLAIAFARLWISEDSFKITWAAKAIPQAEPATQTEEPAQPRLSLRQRLLGLSERLAKRTKTFTPPFEVLNININEPSEEAQPEQQPEEQPPAPTPEPEKPQEPQGTNFLNSLKAIQEQAQPLEKTPIEKMSDTMEEIQRSNEATAATVQQIHETLPQLHPLAFEAAMEAAQSSQNEVRSSLIAKEFMALAQTSAKQHPEVLQHIEGLASKYQNGTALCEQVYACLEELSNKVDKMDSLSRGMTTASEQQDTLIEEIQLLITQLNTLAEEGPDPEWETTQARVAPKTVAFSEEYKEKIQSLFKEEPQTPGESPLIPNMAGLTPGLASSLAQEPQQEQAQPTTPLQEPTFATAGQTTAAKTSPRTPPLPEEELATQMDIQVEVLKEAIDSYAEFSRKSL